MNVQLAKLQTISFLFLYSGGLLFPVISGFIPAESAGRSLRDIQGQTLQFGSRTAYLDTSEPFTVSPQIWEFQGHKCFAEISRPASLGVTDFDIWNRLRPTRPDVVLIHGFGCSTTYWRETRKTFTEAGYTVHALDLLGQGQSAKPGRADNIEYSIDLWAKMVEEYTDKFIPRQTRIVLIGNSLGSTVALSAATGDHWKEDRTKRGTLPSRVQGIGMYNCGIGMNSRNLLKDPNLKTFQRALLTFLFDAFDTLLFGNTPLLTYVLENIVTTDLLRTALLGLYQCAPYPDLRVDDSLVKSFYVPAKDPGSAEALSQIYTNDAGKTPMELHDDHADFLQTIPFHLVWGTVDNVTPISGPVGQFYMDLAKNPEGLVSLDTLKAGHIPFDEIPECNDFMLQWLDDVVMTQKSEIFQWPLAYKKSL